MSKSVGATCGRPRAFKERPYGATMIRYVNDKNNAKSLMASSFHKWFLLPPERCAFPRVILSEGRSPQSKPEG